MKHLTIPEVHSPPSPVVTHLYRQSPLAMRRTLVTVTENHEGVFIVGMETGEMTRDDKFWKEHHAYNVESGWKGAKDGKRQSSQDASPAVQVKISAIVRGV